MSLLAATIRLLTGEVRAVDVAINDAAGNQLSGFDQTRPANAAITTVAVSAVSAVLLALNAARRQVVVQNTSNQTIYIAFAATATTAAFTILIGKNGYWESQMNSYTGVMSVIASGAGNVVVTEVTT